ncbi:MAG: hypothetical protein II008_11765 [Oscillospiraceae bacterium]|nr:hypothetical protein [Oscillospiraceae bacterium]
MSATHKDCIQTMTEIGFEYIKKEIEEFVFDVPCGMKLDELKAWVAGLEHCRDTVLELLDDMKKGQYE